MTLGEIIAEVDQYDLKRVADEIGCAHSTLWRIVTGKTKNPSYDLIVRVEALLAARKAKNGGK
jgi:transcriptional regulator with XRE-family HTH domain